MTTDTVPKTTVQQRDGWTVGGMAKGAGMLAPSLATMLVVLTTDAAVEPAVLQSALRRATGVSVERVDSDGCLSTNDTVLVLANGASGVTPSPDELTEALTAAAADLAMQLLADAEGSTKDIAITVRNAATVEDALTAGRACARNNLLKTALFGNDPNWGRVLAAIGTTDAAFEPDRVDVTINGVTVCRGGAIGDPREGVDLTGRGIDIDVDLRAGTEQATIWTNDLSIAYVHENSAYST
jgi:glutamate N-acetyltransferase / amino-acid N-acetyltransferase